MAKRQKLIALFVGYPQPDQLRDFEFQPPKGVEFWSAEKIPITGITPSTVKGAAVVFYNSTLTVKQRVTLRNMFPGKAHPGTVPEEFMGQLGRFLPTEDCERIIKFLRETKTSRLISLGNFGKGRSVGLWPRSPTRRRF